MNDGNTLMKKTVSIFGLGLVLVVVQSYFIAQLDLPYVIRSILVIIGGSALGLAVSLVWIQWIEAKNSGREWSNRGESPR